MQPSITSRAFLLSYEGKESAFFSSHQTRASWYVLIIYVPGTSDHEPIIILVLDLQDLYRPLQLSTHFGVNLAEGTCLDLDQDIIVRESWQNDLQ